MILIPQFQDSTNLYKRPSGNYLFRVTRDGKDIWITLPTKDAGTARTLRRRWIAEKIACGEAMRVADLKKIYKTVLRREWVIRVPNHPAEFHKTLKQAKARVQVMVAPPKTEKPQP